MMAGAPSGRGDVTVGQDRAVESKETGMGRGLLVVLALLASTAPLSVDFYLPSFPEVQDSLGASATQVQLTLTGFLLGLAFGQPLWGPITDRFGRRAPLLVGVTVSTAAALIATIAPSIQILIAARLVQALAGASAVVISRAIIPDLLHGQAAARAMALMTTINSLAPLIAPIVGGALAGHVSWRGILGIVLAINVLQVLCVVLMVHETLPPERRTAAVEHRHIARVLRRPTFRWNVAVVGFTFAMMMSYISSSSFVYQTVLGAPAWLYGLGFAANACALMAGGAMSARLASRGVAAGRIVRWALPGSAVACGVLILVVLSPLPTWLLVVPLWVAILGAGFSMPNGSTLAMEATRDVAGSGSAVLGGVMFLFGAAVSPLGGLAGDDTAVPFALCMLGSALLGAVALWRGEQVRRRPTADSTG